MAFDKVRTYITTPNPAATVTGTVNLPWDYAELVGFRALNVTDASSGLVIVDSLGRTVCKDGGAVDYHVQKDITISPDATGSGGTVATAHVDATGAALTVGAGISPCVKGPLSVIWSNNGTAGDIMTFDAYVRGPLQRITSTLTVPNPAATVSGTLTLRSKYAQVVGLTALLTGADATTALNIKDADNRIIYVDTARDYTTVKNLLIATDDTQGTLTSVQQDAGGNAATATGIAAAPIARSPLTVDYVGNGTAAEVITFSVWYHVG
jgi:hypothetical protein